MRDIWHLFVDDVRRLTGNVVSVIIVIGLVAIPSLFAWFNIAASWDPFGNMGAMRFAVANDDEGYQSDLIPVLCVDRRRGGGPAARRTRSWIGRSPRGRTRSRARSPGNTMPRW